MPAGQAFAASGMVEQNRWTKKRKAEEEDAAYIPAANVIVQFQSDDGVTVGGCNHNIE